MPTDELGPVEATMAPLLLSIGRAVLGAAALEKVLVVEIARRRSERDGLTSALADELSRLEPQPADALLGQLKRLQLDDRVAARVAEVIVRRNRLVDGFMEDGDVIQTIENGNTASLVDQIDRLGRREDALTLIAKAALPARPARFFVPSKRAVQVGRGPATIAGGRSRWCWATSACGELRPWRDGVATGLGSSRRRADKQVVGRAQRPCFIRARPTPSIGVSRPLRAGSGRM